MLYDPKWDQQTKADPFTVESLITWLEKQPANEVYCYIDHGRCLISQYLIYHGYKNVQVYSDPAFTHGDAETHVSYPDIFNYIAIKKERTFGGALERAREALRSMPSPQGTDR